MLGFPLKCDKVVGPTTTLDFLGIVLDTVTMELHLPEDRTDGEVGSGTRLLDCQSRQNIGSIYHEGNEVVS